MGLGLWTAAGATDISGQRAVLPAWRLRQRTGDCPWAGRRNWLIKISGFDALASDSFRWHVAVFSFYQRTRRVER